MKKIELILKKRPLVCLTANNVYIAEILDSFCDIILVGDSLGMVVYGEDRTNKVSLEMMINHGKAVRKGVKKSMLVIDMPKSTYESSPSLALKNAKKIKKITKCDAIKLEGGAKISKVIKLLVKISSASCNSLIFLLSIFPIILIAKPGPGKGCFSLMLASRPNSFPKFLTSSLKRSFNGSNNLNFIFFGNPPTL